jgi:cellulose synthase/poly-beta-1,6-N-acetylglucosamine synthase-like glycosyltransferase
MTTSDLLLVVWGWSYIPVLLLLLVGLMRLRRSRPVDDALAPSVSVVLSARNESRDLPRCLAALAALDYPRDRLQLVLVNDRSTDDTGPLLEAHAAAHPDVLVLHTAQLPDNGLEAKARGLAHGIAHASGEWILITDADAAVPATWARHLLGDVTPDTVMVGGAITVAPGAWWWLIEATAWAFLQTFSLAAAAFGTPFVCLGPNMGIRRRVYLEAEGLSPTTVHIAEDIALFRMAQQTGGRIRCYFDRGTSVQVTAVPRPQLLAGQLRRWLAGGLEQSRLHTLALGTALAWGIGVAVFAVAGWSVALPAWIGFSVVKLFGEALLLVHHHRRAGLSAPWRALAVLPLYQIVALVYLPASFLIRRPIRWDGDGYSVVYGARSRSGDLPAHDA